MHSVSILMVVSFFCLYIDGIHTQARPQFNVGLILSTDKDEEIAFRSAVERANVDHGELELVPVVVYADTEDSFIMEKTVCKLIAQGVIAIFGPNTAAGSDVVAAICNSLDIPHIVYDWSPNESLDDRVHSEMTLNLHPNNVQFARGIAEISQSFDWRSFTVVYDSDKGLQQLQDILQLGDPNSKPTTLRRLEDGMDHRPFLKSIKMSTDNCLILMCEVQKILSILRDANDLKMLGEYQSIFIPVLDTHTLDLQEIQGVLANITTIRLMDPTEYNVINIARDWEERENREHRYYRVPPNRMKTNMILLNDAVWIFSKGLRELGLGDNLSPPRVDCRRHRQWPQGKKIIEFIRSRPEEVATGRVDFNAYGQRSYFKLYFMELTLSGYFDLATWDPVDRLTLLTNQDASDKRVDDKLSNKTFIVTSRLGAPFLSMRPAKDGEILVGNARYEGYSMDLIDAIANLLNCKYEFQLAPDGNYGSFNKETQQWDGLVKQLLDGNADLGICDLTMTSARRQAVDFTPPFMTLGISILYKKPVAPPPELFSFLSPFSVDVWIYMGTAYLGVSFLLYGLSRMAPDDWENPHPCKEPEEVENPWYIMNTTWLTMGSLMGQGCDILPKAASTRLVTGMWWFFALMMLNSYTANLAAFLTSSRMDSSIESAEDLATQSKIKYGAVLGGSTLAFFKDSNFTTYQRMWAAMETARPSVFTKSNDEGVERVQKGKGLYAYLMESTTLEYIVERKCDLMQVGGWLDYKTYGVAMPFNSPYRKKISGAVLKLGESGTLAEIKRKWWKEMYGGGNCSSASAKVSDTPELDLQNVGGVFLVLGIGLLSAFLLGMLDFLWNVKQVAIDEKIALTEALKLELMFCMKFWITTKPVRTSSMHSSSGSSHSSSSKRSSKSLGQSTEHSLKSLKSSGETQTVSVHDKLKKISSIFSLKSLRSDGDPPDVAAEAAEDPSGHVKIDKATQMEERHGMAIEVKTSDEGEEFPEPPPQPEPEMERHRHRHHHHHHRRRKSHRDSKASGMSINDVANV